MHAFLLSLFLSSAMSQQFGVFAWSAPGAGLLLKLNVSDGKSTPLSAGPDPSQCPATDAARIHPTFKYWYQVKDAGDVWLVEGRQLSPGAFITSTTQLPTPKACSEDVEGNWVLFDLECAGRPMFLVGVPHDGQLLLAVIQLDGTWKCLGDVPLADSVPKVGLPSALDLDFMLYLSLNSSVVAVNISEQPAKVVGTVNYPEPMTLSRLHYDHSLNLLFGLYVAGDGVGMMTLNPDAMTLSRSAPLSGWTAPSPLLSALDTDNARLVAILIQNNTRYYVSVDVSTGKLQTSAQCSDHDIVSIDALARVF